MFAIVATQSIGVVVGTIAPISRCFTILSFKSFAKWDSNHFAIFKIEKYWTQMLCEWKESHVTFPSSSHRATNLFHHLKNRILSFCIRFQKVIVVSCKMLGLIPIAVIFFVTYCSYYLKSLMTMLFTPPVASSTDTTYEDLSNYVLLLEDNAVFGEKTLKGISNSMNRLIQKAVKDHQKNLLKLLEKSIRFEGVEKFDNDQVHLFKSVGEGLFYTHIVEENLNGASEYVNVQRAAKNLWPKAIVIEVKENTNGESEPAENLPHKLIVANSMYRIAQTLLVTYRSNIVEISEDRLFTLTTHMISDIFSACFTNLPRVITMKCHESAIEKREDSVVGAAKLLGRTTEIIKRLEKRELPNMDPDKMAFIDEWRHHLNNQSLRTNCCSAYAKVIPSTSLS
ncbi:hypothetical protein CTI12_AA177070 [Artemisia annua]|uniref:Uncharacterized protein n=1 Tax=Artemisia annua TaxID=35608 RepID=A0A2U1NZN3_ARTAN|nr:hypothetical protein CTI12_AA177070 [Artemisia annua]